MKKQIKRRVFLWLLPVIVCVLSFGFLIAMMASFLGMQVEEESSDGTGCSVTGEVDVAKLNEGLKRAGVFQGKGQLFVDIAEKQGIDPILFIAISMSETGWGKSNAVREKNNPGGIMDSATNMQTVKHFASLEEGLEAMGVTLHNRIVKDGLNTIDKLGNVYAPIGVSNDPTNLNANWIPTVKGIAEKFGGLTSGCDSGGNTGTGHYIIPVDAPVISSGFINRINPVTGAFESHKGLDFAQPIGSNIKAADDGVVVFASFGIRGHGFGDYGNCVLIEHAKTKEWTLYAHQSELLVKVGQHVQKGEIIGKVGSTGQSTGPHLHFEVRKSKMGNQVNPAIVLGIKGAK
ncbi:peptidoglycan DD-metalloendopeptidase family protein [Listeria fleischmannii]|uniref:peptidoglycan DD-metalloendopeptidase family protein n=1 Tax=Listeria fleischmannii TaxID=1069827 RepID=UPI0020B8DAEB|nr:peptidoglycan DD-metalloendopeptidase family protein [Listeria fleischmannii]